MKKFEPKLELSGLNSESEHIRKEIIKELSRFDISQNQSKTYIFLSKSGPKTASQIAKSLNLPRTETYNILNQLQSKRIVIANLTKPIKFEAVAIKNAVEILVENERNHIDRLIETTSEILNLWNMLPESVPIDKLLVGNRFQLIQGKNS
ncbi:MAG: TrmB family transcriptional regulator, partial [Nitrosopumilaceae archaeon]